MFCKLLSIPISITRRFLSISLYFSIGSETTILDTLLHFVPQPYFQSYSLLPAHCSLLLLYSTLLSPLLPSNFSKHLHKRSHLIDHHKQRSAYIYPLRTSPLPQISKPRLPTSHPHVNGKNVPHVHQRDYYKKPFYDLGVRGDVADHHIKRPHDEVHVCELGEGADDGRGERCEGVGSEQRRLGSKEIVRGEIELQG